MIGIASVLAVLATPRADTPPLDLKWLEGHWCTDVTDGRQTCELWGPERGGTMLGTSQTVRDSRSTSFEFIRIVWNQPWDHAVIRLALIAAPQGRDPVTFGWSPSRETGVTFFNTAHDYPQRIHYRVAGDVLTAEISLANGSKAMRWTFNRVR